MSTNDSKTFHIPQLRQPDATPVIVNRDGGSVVYEPIRALRTQDEVRTCLRLGSMGSDAVWTAVLSVAFQPETLSTLMPLAMQSDKRKAASKVSGALKRAVLAVAGESPVNPDTVGQYASTVAQHFAKGREQSLIACYSGEGEETHISAFVPRAALLRSDSKAKETAANCLVRLCGAYDIHAGSGIPTGTVGPDKCKSIVHALAQSLGYGGFRNLLSEIEEDQSSNTSDSNEQANTAAAERIKALLTHGAEVAEAVK